MPRRQPLNHILLADLSQSAHTSYAMWSSLIGLEAENLGLFGNLLSIIDISQSLRLDVLPGSWWELLRGPKSALTDTLEV